jgi:hypothetical protein
MSKHTPGPHTVEYAPHLGDPAYAIRAGDGDLIAVGLVKGDADLFAAAPGLLSALRAAHKTIASMGADLEVAAPQSINANTYQDELRRISATLTKATGAA